MAGCQQRPAGIGTLELLVDAGLLKDGVGSPLGFDTAVDGDLEAGNRAIPDLVVAFPLSDESATVCLQ